MSQVIAVQHRGAHVRRAVYTRTTPRAALCEDQTSQAIAFFARHYLLDQEPRGGPGPGLFGFLRPALFGAETSAASMAVSALAVSIYSRWRKDETVVRCVPKMLGQAIRSLSDNLRTLSSRRTDDTLLTTLVLQFHSSFESLFSSETSTIVHHLGALALVREFGPPETWTNLARQFVGYIFHVEVTAAIREHRQVNLELCYWSSVSETSSMNPERQLDLLGIKVADIQFRFDMIVRNAGSADSLANVETFLNDIQELDERLLVWQEQYSHHWGPFSWTSLEAVNPPIQAFEGTCHVYTSICAARLMNDWRSYRLTIALLHLHLQMTRGPKRRDIETNVISTYTLVKRVQWLVDGVCASVPFFLGNRTNVGTVLDFDDPTWKFPTCHDMCEMYDLRGHPAKPMGLETLADHTSHAISQGVWYIMGNLTQLIAFFLTNGSLSPLLSLRAGQSSWICHQYLRNLSLLSIEWTRDSSLVEKVLTGVHLPGEAILSAEASRCVQRVLRGMRMTGNS